jgi:hypothetical protein
MHKRQLLSSCRLSGLTLRNRALAGPKRRLQLSPTAPADDMPPAITARVHARSNGTAARGTIEVLAFIEPLCGIMPIWSEAIITVAAGHIVVSGGSERHHVQKPNCNAGLRYCSHCRPPRLPSKNAFSSPCSKVTTESAEHILASARFQRQL